MSFKRAPHRSSLNMHSGLGKHTVARHVPGKTAQQCQARLSGDGGSGAPVAGGGGEKRKATAAPAGAKAASKRAAIKDEPSSDDDDEEDDDGGDDADAGAFQSSTIKPRTAITGHKGTLKRRRQLRQLLQEVWIRTGGDGVGHWLTPAHLVCCVDCTAQRSPKHVDRFAGSPATGSKPKHSPSAAAKGSATKASPAGKPPLVQRGGGGAAPTAHKMMTVHKHNQRTQRNSDCWPRPALTTRPALALVSAHLGWVSRKRPRRCGRRSR